jgi:exodeoxyribonuclease VII large subunit
VTTHLRQSGDVAQLGLSFEAPVPSARHIWKVGELVGEVRTHVEREYGDLWVEGEISNLRSAPSGHIYFTLKDGEAQLPAVLFRRQASLLRFRPADGLHILLRGKVSVYEQRGQMQLVAEFLEPVGAGSLQLAFEQLKAKLQARGFFDAERKKPLPAFPRCVGIVTSPAGAVIRDFLNVAGRRHSALHVVLYPALVQGEAAAAEVAAGIAYFNQTREVDLIVIARGGGSLEDLAPFNSELLAEAIAASELPVVSAIGHETDFTIADFVADLRAPTPSAAAELITAAQHRIEDRIGDLSSRLQRACRYRLLQAANALARVPVESILMRATDGLYRRQQRVDDLTTRIEFAWRARHRNAAESLQHSASRLQRQDVSHRLRIARERYNACDAAMQRAQRNHLAACRARQESLAKQLGSLSPLSILNRGYALVFDESGTLIRSAQQVEEGQALATQIAGGRIESRVTGVHREEKK